MENEEYLQMLLQQGIQNFMGSLDGGDVIGMERIKRNIMDVLKNLKNTKSLDALNEWELKQGFNLVEEIKNNHIPEVIDSIPVMESVFMNYDRIKNDVVGSLNEIEQRYWEGIRAIFLKSL